MQRKKRGECCMMEKSAKKSYPQLTRSVRVRENKKRDERTRKFFRDTNPNSRGRLNLQLVHRIENTVDGARKNCSSKFLTKPSWQRKKRQPRQRREDNLLPPYKIPPEFRRDFLRAAQTRRVTENRYTGFPLQDKSRISP